MVGELCFALPPSLGHDPVRELARQFADVLYSAGFSTIKPYKSYYEMETALHRGEAHAAWGPPIVCASLEAAGGITVVRAVRYGAVTYRSVLLARTDSGIDIKRIGNPGMRPLKAAWVDPWSMAGYILPRHHLRTLAVEPTAAFAEELVLGSYDACFQAVLGGQADLTASFAGRSGLGYVELCGTRARELRTLAFTRECPNDGIVLSPTVTGDARAELTAALHSLLDRPAARDKLSRTFDTDDFDIPPADTYKTLWDLVELG